MSRSIVGIFSGVVLVMITFVVMWALDLPSLSSIFGAVSGMIGGVLGVTYLHQLKDERFTHIMNLAARNAFVFLMIALPLDSVVLVLAEEITLQIAALLIFVPWMSSLVILYLSLFYYYRR